jgi:hypothetical protein
MLKHLTLDEMVALVSPWVKNARRKTLFLSIPEIAPLHPKVIAAHRAVLSVRPSEKSKSDKMLILDAKAAVVDARHDHAAKAVSFGIDSYREHCLAQDPPDKERAAKCDVMQKKLFLGGLQIINASTTAESGNTARIAHLLEEEPEVAAFLKAIPAPEKKTLWHTTQQWIQEGKALAAIDHEREELSAKEKTAPAARATITAARREWFRVVSAVLANLELSDASAEAIETIRGPVLKASDRAGKRYAAGRSAGEATDEAPEEDDDEASPEPEEEDADDDA